MEGPPKTPEPTPVTMATKENNNDTFLTSPMKPLHPPVAGHHARGVAEHTIPPALQRVSEEQMYELLGITEEEMKKAFPNCPTMTVTQKLHKKFDENTVTEYLNILSDLVHKYLGWSINATLINKLTRQMLRRASRSHSFLQAQSPCSEGSPHRHNQSS